MFKKIFSIFETWSSAFPDEKIEQPPTGLFAFCVFYSRGFIKPLILLAVLSAIIAILEVSLFGFMGQLVDLLSPKDPVTFFSTEKTHLILMGAITLIALPLCIYIQSLVMYQTLLGNFPMRIRWHSHNYLLKQSVAFYQNDFSGRIATKVMQNALAVRETVMKILNIAVYLLVYFASMLVLIASLDIYLVIPIIIWLIIYCSLQFYFIPKLKAVAESQADARSLMSGRIVDSYINISTVKLFSHTKSEATYAKDSMQKFLKTVYQQMRLATSISTLTQFANYLLVFSIAALSLWLWSYSAVSVGAIAIAISLSLRINTMSQWIMWELSGLFENIGTISDSINTLSRPIAVEDMPDATELNVSRGDVEFKNLSFYYNKDNGIIEDLNLAIKAGEKIGLVGISGAGKSTLVNLLLRFYEVGSGQILIDGQDINKVTQDSLRANIGVVSQDTSLLHRSVRENIRYGKIDATEEEIIAAAKQSEAHEFILSLTSSENKGYDAEVGERGVQLSGGQRQRIAIARVLLKNAPILILDEATSALDSEVEAVIQEQLYKLMQGKTVIAIAHRLSTIATMDRLVVLDKGKIVEMGTHAELISHKGIYANLWNRQTNGFLGIEQ